MFKNFFRKVRATLKNSPEALAIAAGAATGLPIFDKMNPLAKVATKFLPNLLTAQYQKNPLQTFLVNQALTAGTEKLVGTDFAQGILNPNAVTTTDSGNMIDPTGNQTVPGIKGLTAEQAAEASAGMGQEMKGLMGLDKLQKDKTGTRVLDFFTGLVDEDGLTGKGKLLGSLAATLGPGLATYLALVGDTPESQICCEPWSKSRGY